jgi:hypothetical protein
MEFENNTLQLPYAEGKEIANSGSVTLLYPVSTPIGIAHYDGTFQFDRDTEGRFPAIATVHADGKFHEDLSAFKTRLWDGVGDEVQRFNVLNAGRFWNFLGDGTHSSTLVKTPFGLCVGDELQVENRYNVAPLKARVHDIALLRVQDVNTWMWRLTLNAILDETSSASQ